MLVVQMPVAVAAVVGRKRGDEEDESLGGNWDNTHCYSVDEVHVRVDEMVVEQLQMDELTSSTGVAAECGLGSCQMDIHVAAAAAAEGEEVPVLVHVAESHRTQDRHCLQGKGNDNLDKRDDAVVVVVVVQYQQLSTVLEQRNSAVVCSAVVHVVAMAAVVVVAVRMIQITWSWGELSQKWTK